MDRLFVCKGDYVICDLYGLIVIDEGVDKYFDCDEKLFVLDGY